MKVAILRNSAVVNTVVVENAAAANVLFDSWVPADNASPNDYWISELGRFAKTPQPYPSWTLPEDSKIWEAPVAKPEDDQDYIWNEETQAWDVVEEPAAPEAPAE